MNALGVTGLRQNPMSVGWTRLNSLRKRRRVQTAFALSLVALGPVLVILTFYIIRQQTTGLSSQTLRGVLLFDLVYIILIAAFVTRRIVQMISARRAKSAGSQLHLRLTSVFMLVALAPTILVAVLATVALNFGLEGWFSERVRNVVGSSLTAAEAYEKEERSGLEKDTRIVARVINQSRGSGPLASDGSLRVYLSQGQALIQRGLKEAYVIDGATDIRARGDRSYLFDFETPSADEISRAEAGELVVIKDWNNDEFRALLKLASFVDRYLYISREVDGELLSLLDETKESVKIYNQLENDRDAILFQFALLYLGFAIIVILAAILLAFWFADRLAKPVGRLAGAVQRVGAGDLDVKVREEAGDDEIAMLSRVFNQMTKQVKGQRDALVDSNARTERRRRLFDSVLSGVTAGVIGLNQNGEIELMNAAAAKMLNLDEEADLGMDVTLAVPEFVPLFNDLREKHARSKQGEINLTRAGNSESLLVRIAARLRSDDTLEGYVITFDDVTDLVSAQRMAAWGDVARRIAHEIKNPLTPIQLSAERLQRKFAPLVGDQADLLNQYSEVIIRQTADLRRIVDEFSKFARMPEPEKRLCDLSKLVSDAVLLQQSALGHIKISLSNENKAVMADIDATMINQALTNLIKNSGEAIESYQKSTVAEGFQPEIRISMNLVDGATEILIEDNGIGLPEQRARLFEPYVTNRENGTGLGLSIVKKIIEEHGGTLELLDAELFEGNDHCGATARVVLPVTGAQQKEMNKSKVA